jgi:NADPH:quinone reductase-like Zn-dependent oxidoreductase
MAKVLKMRIHSFGDSAVLQADTVEPSLADASQVLVSVKAASVNSVDFKIRSGKYPAVNEIAGRSDRFFWLRLRFSCC